MMISTLIQPRFKRLSKKTLEKVDQLSKTGVFDKEILYQHFGDFTKDPDSQNSREVVIQDITRRTQKTNPSTPTINLGDGEAMIAIAHDKRMRKFNFKSIIENQHEFVSEAVLEKIIETENNGFFALYMSETQLDLFEKYSSQTLIDGKVQM